jgi:2-dehydropantoate 2-reductase
LGAGSIGCLFAAYLRRANCDIRLILRDAASLALLQSKGGITLEREGQRTSIDVDAVTAKTIATPISHLLICTKAPQTLAALKSLKAHLSDKPVLVLLQNGMGVRESVVDLLPDAIVLHAITTNGAYQRERFHLVHAGCGDTQIGALHSREQPHAEHAASALQCELPIAAVTDIEHRLWQKLAINSVINPLTAIYQCRNGDLLDIPDIETIIARLCTEFIAVARAENLHFDLAALRDDILRVARDTAQNRSSMLQDIVACRPTEIDYINGFILRRAALHKVWCPEHALLFDTIKQKEHAFT